MLIREIKEEKLKLEKEIASEVSRLVENFRSKTSISPSSIYINLESVDTMEDIMSQYAVTGAIIDIQI